VVVTSLAEHAGSGGSDHDSGDGTDVLDVAAWASLTGPHAGFAQGSGQVLRYPPDVSPFVAVAPGADDGFWADLHALAGDGVDVAVASAVDVATAPPGWGVVGPIDGVQLIGTDRFVTAPDPEAVRLGDDDVPEMLDLIARTQPGPFLPRTHTLGTYLGLRREGRLVAMAGERLHPPGWREISAVCTDAAFRNQGLAARLVRAVGHGIAERGERPLMHASAANTGAIRLYLELGFVVHRHLSFHALTTPAGPDTPKDSR
jgi:ribosomal protein S18 acetylase RimI-like enzyme